MSRGIFLLVLSNLLIPVAILVFAKGFFPYKPFIPGKATFTEFDDGRQRERPPFDKVIFMVVDALRSDFVYGPDSGFQFTQSLIRSGSAIPFTAHATSPTITMPRIKAITTGSIPSFLDVILNFAESDTTATLSNQDTWLSQLQEMPNGKLIMFGDDTWLKLFPDTFSRADGTTSFFVSDFTEVDNNVTRNISPELEQHDWNGMIMHYLGLDHIGHKTGPKGPHMIPKQVEMDGIVQLLYEAIELNTTFASTLLILAGDHGMNDAGNHGGSAEGETSPALLFISPKLKRISKGDPCPLFLPHGHYDYYDSVEQSDIAPTLAAMLGFPVPLNNMGVLISKFLPLWSNNHAFRLMEENARQILNIVQGTFSGFDFNAKTEPAYCSSPQSDGEVLSCLWFEVTIGAKGDNLVVGDHTINSLKEFCQQAQQVMSSTASNYNLTNLFLGIGIGLVAFFASLFASLNSLYKAGTTGVWTILVAGSYGVMMFASSFVEEEQHFWHWTASGWLAWQMIKRGRSIVGDRVLQTTSMLLLVTSLRILRRWNQTGQKHAGESDIAKTFLPAHNLLLWVLVVLSYLIITPNLLIKGAPGVSRIVSIVAVAALLASAIRFKIAFTKADAPELLSGMDMLSLGSIDTTSLVTQVRFVFLGSFAFLSLAVGSRMRQKLSTGRTTHKILPFCHSIITLFLITQTRTTNVPAFLLFHAQYLCLKYSQFSPPELSLTCLVFQYASFFSFGGSNAISSIDLSNAYNGVSGYNVGAVGILTFFSNWTGPVWWTSATALLLTDQKSNKERLEYRRANNSGVLRYFIALLTFFASSSVLAVMVACLILRTHLFIWTVFSPKYLYTMAWSIGQHFCINIGLGSLLLWIGSW